MDLDLVVVEVPFEVESPADLRPTRRHELPSAYRADAVHPDNGDQENHQSGAFGSMPRPNLISGSECMCYRHCTPDA